ncbi:MAG: filamentous hemagglutinin N-terminal domain-containing protein [Nitrospirota bacterium]|nr:filamentous hemagglutinin N-terminal domain-containing protein [Nitrospirota bacterium]
MALPSHSQQGGVPTKLTSSGLGTDIVLPPAGGNVFNINGGTVKTGSTGNNLFHSFGEFSVGAGDMARFNNTTFAPSIANILARVTGDNISSIFGTVESTVPGANLFLINPRGVVFGPNASLQVSGSVHFSTADAIVHSDGVRFDMTSTSNTLTAAPISAFGFLGNPVGSIVVQGSQLSTASGKTLSLIGGNVDIRAGTLDDGTVQPARLTAPSGQINVTSVASAAHISLTTLETTISGGNSPPIFGTISIAEQSLLDASGSPGGTIRIRGGQFTMDRSAVTVAHAGEGIAGEINIVADLVNLTGGAQIVSTNTGTTPGPAITITANESIAISGFDTEGTLTGIVPTVFGPVPSGIISMTSSSGTGGSITIARQGATVSPTVTLEEGGAVASITSGSGAGGDLVLTDIKALEVKSGGQITSTSGLFDLETGETLGSGTGGQITIRAGESVNIAGGQLDLFQQSAIFSNTSTTGKGGDISISAPTITVGEGGAVVSNAGAGGAGGALTVTDFSTLAITGFSPGFLNSVIVSNASANGTGGHITLSSPEGTVLVDQLGVVRSQNTGSASGGDIVANTRDVMITNGGAIEASATSSTGSSGKITLTAEHDVRIIGQVQDPVNPEAFARSHVFNNVSGIDSQSGTNNGIAIVATHDVEVSGGGRVESITGTGNGGNTSISADHAITLSEPLTIGMSTLDGSVGSLTLNAPIITLQARAVISSSSASNAAAGEIRLAGDVITLKESSSIRSNTQQGTGRGGTIVVDAEDSVFLSGGSSIQSNTTTSQGGHAGSITVNADNLVSLSGAETGIFSESGSGTSLGTGNGGMISLQSSQVRITDGAVISAKSNGSGAAGSVTIEGTASPAQSIRIEGVGSGLFTETQGTGKGGDMTVWANQVQLTDGATISSKTTSSGNAGDIILKINELRIDGGATITAASTGSGNAGTVTIQGINSPANSVLIEGAGTGLFTNTEDQGRGGGVSIDTRTLTMQNGGTISAATSGTDALATGGNISITASQSVDLRSNASISSRSTGDADAGNISINAGNRFDARNSSVTTRSDNAGGGNIEINALDQIRLVNSQVNASAFMNGGNISIDPNLVILQNSSILAQAIQGNGGNITIFTPLFLADSSSLVSASSQFGLSGTVTIQSPTSNLSGSLGTLASKPRQAQSLLTQRCAALANGQASSFVVAGREQLPADPGGWLTSPLALAGLDADPFSEGTVAEGTSNLAPRTAGLMANGTVSLRRFTPAGFLMANYADSEATGCHS